MGSEGQFRWPSVPTALSVCVPMHTCLRVVLRVEEKPVHCLLNNRYRGYQFSLENQGYKHGKGKGHILGETHI